MSAALELDGSKECANWIGINNTSIREDTAVISVKWGRLCDREASGWQQRATTDRTNNLMFIVMRHASVNVVVA